jgi:type II secretory ATPase GspE/PulE/Tfp pilus assembly ATPase PilB-like protein
MAKLDIAEKRLPQDGRIKIKIAGKDIDIRLSTTPVQNGERIVMRVLEKSNTVLELGKLGFHGASSEEPSKTWQEENTEFSTLQDLLVTVKQLPYSQYPG